MRIPIPTKPDALIQMAKLVKAKHAAMGQASPLNSIKGIELFPDLLAAAETNNDLAADLERKMGNAVELRDNALGQQSPLQANTVRFFMMSIRDVLSGMNKNNLHALGDWGFVVEEGTTAAKTATATAKPSTT